MSRRVRDPDPYTDPPTGGLVDKGGALREILDRAGIDRRDRGAEDGASGGQRQGCALRHVAEHARHVEAGKAAPLRLPRYIEGDMPPPRNGNQAQRRQGFGHRAGLLGNSRGSEGTEASSSDELVKSTQSPQRFLVL